MKALILNSGTGSRLAGKNMCKCLTQLASSGETILDLQIKALLRCMIDDIYITTGPYAAQIEQYIQERYAGQCKVTFIHNPLYEKTNYIYSMQLAGRYLKDSQLLLMHGDLVFEQNVLQDIAASKHSVMVTDSSKPLPEKDFKAAVTNGRITEIGVDIFKNAQYAQPLYKLTKQDWQLWGGEIDSFCRSGKTSVYAEDAFNEISSKSDLRALDITGRICMEVDTDEDLAQAREAYAIMPDRLQDVYAGCGSRGFISRIIKKTNAVKPFVACGIKQETAKELIGDNAIYRNITKPNPEIGDIEEHAAIFVKEKCDFMISIGGGSAIDTAKCIIHKNPQIEHLAIPTSAGTGSESTQFAVIYKDCVKQSLEDRQILPDYVILDPHFLKTLPGYHKKSTLLDALCQAIESLWAKGRTGQSASYARAALRIMNEDAQEYLTGNDEETALRILSAANLSGKAININKTTAAHAMSYVLSATYGIAHGHAVALCLAPVWKKLRDAGMAPPELGEEQYKAFMQLFESMELGSIKEPAEVPLQKLTESVNKQRLGNHPMELTNEELREMYREIIR